MVLSSTCLRLPNSQHVAMPFENKQGRARHQIPKSRSGYEFIESPTALTSSNIEMHTVESELTSTFREILILIQKVRMLKQQETDIFAPS